jgi:hypothetical protein
MIADNVDVSIRGRVLSTFQGANMIGSAAGPAIGGIIAELYGYRMPFFFYGAFVLVSLIVSFLFVKESSNPIHQEERSTVGTDMRRLLAYFTFPILIAAFANFSNHMRNSARGFILPLHASINLGLSPGEIGLAHALDGQDHRAENEKIKEICQIIRGHDSRKRPLSWNDRIVKDSDKLWRYSRRGMAIDLGRFRIPRRDYLVFLEAIIDHWFLTVTGKEIARKEISIRKKDRP